MNTMEKIEKYNYTRNVEKIETYSLKHIEKTLMVIPENSPDQLYCCNRIEALLGFYIMPNADNP